MKVPYVCPITTPDFRLRPMSMAMYDLTTGSWSNNTAEQGIRKYIFHRNNCQSWIMQNSDIDTTMCLKITTLLICIHHRYNGFSPLGKRTWFFKEPPFLELYTTGHISFWLRSRVDTDKRPLSENCATEVSRFYGLSRVDMDLQTIIRENYVIYPLFGYKRGPSY